MSIFENARKVSQVCPNELKKMVYGDEETYQKMLALVEVAKKHCPKEETAKYHELDRIDQIKYSYKFLSELIRSGLIDTSKGQFPFELYFLLNFEVSGGVSALMVRPLIETLCSAEQQKKWLPLFDTSRVIGAYAQTELGHGSDVQSLETEAVFDEKTQEFILNSPTVSSYKWWPGELSNLSTVAMVYAKTIVKGRKIGVLPFIVPIRHMDTHKPLPGVEIGDIGPKMGYGAKENGFLKFDHYRIPLDNMPSRFMEVTSKGEVLQKGNPKIVYSAMMKSRTALLNASSYNLGKGVAIAIRYSFLRRQFKNDRKEEVPVIQYQLQQFKLFPLLAKSFAMQCAFRKINEVIAVCNTQISQNNFQGLQETHVILSGTKAFFTWWCSNGLYVCMQCCGGHGYSQFSGIPSLIQSFAPNTILEGENTMLTLQVGRYLLKCYKHVMEGKPEKVQGSCGYLKQADALTGFNTKYDANLLEKGGMKQLWQKAVVVKLTETAELIAEQSQHMSILDVFNKKAGIHVFELAKLHTILLTYDYFVEYATEIKDAPTKTAFLNLAQLFVIDLTLESAGILLPMGILDSVQVKGLQKEFERLLEELFKDSLKLAEAWVLDDYMLHSSISEVNEKPYENLYNMAKAAGVLNKTDLTGAYLETIRKASIETFGKPKL